MRAEHRREQPSRQEARRQAREFEAQVWETAHKMGAKIPRHYYAPGPGKMLTAAQYVKALRMIYAADDCQEFPRSFNCWYPQTKDEIIEHEIRPAIHERINARGLMERRNEQITA